jgi:5,10-methylenetetrahydromethanopterin reductase
MPISIDVTIPLSLPVSEIIHWVKNAERSGFHGVGLADHPERGHDAFVLLALAASNTSNISLYPSIANPVTRDSVNLATSINTLNGIAPGRIKLAIGAGDSALKPFGRKPANLDQIRTGVSLIKDLLNGDPIFTGPNTKEFRIPIYKPIPPVMVVGSGPRIIELAGEIGDEAMIMAGLHTKMLDAVNHQLELGIKKSNRSLEDFLVTHYILLSIDEEIEIAQERCRNWLHYWNSQGLFKYALKAINFPQVEFDRPTDIPKTVLSQLCDLLFIAGTPEYCTKRLNELSSNGVKKVACLIPGPLPIVEKTFDLLAINILPNLT